MPPSILSSPFMDPTILSKLLQNPSLLPGERLSLLQAKLAALINSTNASSTKAADDPSMVEAIKRVIEEVQTRLEIARLFITSSPFRLVEAEAEIGVAEGKCKETAKAFKKSRTGSMAGRDPSKVTSEGVESTDQTISGNLQTRAETGSACPESIAAERGEDRGGPLIDREEETGMDRSILQLIRLRIEALELLGEVEESLGRSGRAKKRRELAEQLQREIRWSH